MKGIIKSIDVLILIFLFVIIMLFRKNAYFGVDPTVQFYQLLTGCYSDWHPPIMVYMWKNLLHISKNVNILYYFHLSLFFIGVLLINKTLKMKSILLSFIFTIFILIIIFYENFLFYIWKDAGMFCSFLFILGMFLNLPYIKSKITRYFIVLIGLLVNFYAMGIRSNSIFAGLTMIIFILFCFYNKIIKSIILGIFIWVITLFSINIVTYKYLNTKKLYPIKYIMISDIFQINYRLNKEIPAFLQGSGYSYEKVEELFINIPNINKYILNKKPLINLLGISVLSNGITEYDINKISKKNLEEYIRRYNNLDEIEIEENYKLIKQYWFKTILENPQIFLKIKIKYFIGLIGIPMICLIFINLILQYIYSIKRKNIKPLLIYLSSCFYLWPYFIFNASYDYRYIAYCILTETFMFVYILYTNMEEIFEKIKKLKIKEKEWMNK